MEAGLQTVQKTLRIPCLFVQLCQMGLSSQLLSPQVVCVPYSLCRYFKYNCFLSNRLHVMFRF